MRAAGATAIAAGLGVLAGACAAWIAVDRGWLPGPGPQRVAARPNAVPKVSLAEADAQRASRFSGIRTVGDTLALPGDFAQTEALYALAGRSDSAAVQNLIFEAAGIADPSDRRAGLSILFSRLAELDPASALALARSGDFAALPYLERTVWETWGKLDPDGALEAAAREPRSRRARAAQALYAAFDGIGDETTGRIAARLGIEPDEETRARYLYGLAETDPAAAVAWVNALSPARRPHAASLLGGWLGERDPESALRHGAALADPAARTRFEVSVATARARSAPEDVLDAILDGPVTRETLAAAGVAADAIAERDLDRARDYLEQIRSPDVRRRLATAIAGRLALSDPYEALAWAKGLDGTAGNVAWLGALDAIAAIQPDLAIDEAAAERRGDRRMQALNLVANRLVAGDPARAVAMLGRLDNRRDREIVTQTLTMSWLQSDPDAAMEWILGSEPDVRRNALPQAASMLAQLDVDSAMRILPRLDDASAAEWRRQIAVNLAAQRSVADAESFVARYENSADYPQLLLQVIETAAQTDPDAAIRLLQKLPDGSLPAGAGVSFMSGMAFRSPEAGAVMLAAMPGDAARIEAGTLLADAWAQSDPDAAERWAFGLPAGDLRDAAIAQIAGHWDVLSPERRALLDGLPANRRDEFWMNRIMLEASQGDPASAERMLRDAPMSDEAREATAGYLESMRGR